jgi:hypothetical protein
VSRRLVRHRWNMPEDQDPPQPGKVIRSAAMNRAWRVVAVFPIESRIHPNAWRGVLEPMTWKPGDHYDAYYPSARERASADP